MSIYLFGFVSTFKGTTLHMNWKSRNVNWKIRWLRNYGKLEFNLCVCVSPPLMSFSPSANNVGTQACAQACLIAMALRSACITSWHPQNSIPARKPKNASSAPRPIAIVQCNSLGHPLVKRHGTRGVIIPVNLKEIPPGDHWGFSYRILAKVSRSFFLVIQELPPELRNTVRSLMFSSFFPILWSDVRFQATHGYDN